MGVPEKGSLNFFTGGVGESLPTAVLDMITPESIIYIRQIQKV